MKYFTFMVALLAAISLSAQDKPLSEQENNHEIKVGLLRLATPQLELTYEYMVGERFTIGASGSVNFKDTMEEQAELYGFTPFARFYLFESRDYMGRGMFIEGFLKYARGKDAELYTGQPDLEYDAGLAGLSVGKKWITDFGLVFEIMFGYGAEVVGGSEDSGDIIRGDFSIGYRF